MPDKAAKMPDNEASQALLAAGRWLFAQGCEFKKGVVSLEALPPADRLEIAHGSALLTMDRTAFDNSGNSVEYGHHCYRPDLYSFETTLVEK